MSGAIHSSLRARVMEEGRCRAKPLHQCARCGCLISAKRRKYCGPCASIRNDETVAANRVKARERRLG